MVERVVQGSTLLAIYLGSAAIGGIVVIGQALLGLLGVGADDLDLDVDTDHGAGLGFLSVRTLAAFLTIFGLVGWAGAASGWPLVAHTATAFLAGGSVAVLVGWLMRFFRNLQSEGTVRLDDAVGRIATVYLRIPGARAGAGKITVGLQGRSTDAPRPAAYRARSTGAAPSSSRSSRTISTSRWIPCRLGTDPATMENAAIRLLGLEAHEIVKQAEDIILGQLRQVIASMRIEEINRDGDTFLSNVQQSLEPELKKIGLVLINLNIKDIKDESGYIEAIGRKAAATAVKQAEIDVAEQVRTGAIGVARADRERLVEVANAEKERDIGTKDAERERSVRIAELEKERTVGEQTAQFERDALVSDREREKRIRVADADAKAVTGENEAKARVAQTNAELRVVESEAFQRAETRAREAQAAVLEAQYLAEARGQFEILAKKGEGLKRIIESCGGAQPAFQMLMLEHIEHLSATAAKAISNIKFDKVVVWDSGHAGANGSTSATSNFLRGLAGSLPPTLQLMKDIGGVDMPEYFGRLSGEPAAEKKPQGGPDGSEPAAS